MLFVQVDMPWSHSASAAGVRNQQPATRLCWQLVLLRPHNLVRATHAAVTFTVYAQVCIHAQHADKYANPKRAATHPAEGIKLAVQHKA